MRRVERLAAIEAEASQISGVQIVARAVNKRAFLASIGPDAARVAASTGADLVALLTHAALESDWGTSRLSTDGYNLFGIKKGSTWKGATITFPTQEYRNGRYVTESAAFRRYASYQQSFLDLLSLLERVYPTSYKAITTGNRETYFRSLNAGSPKYSTDPNYASKLSATARSLQADYALELQQLQSAGSSRLRTALATLSIAAMVGTGIYLTYTVTRR